MPDTPPLPDVLSRLKTGDAEASRQIFERFATRLVALARTRINETLLSKLDPEDVIQSVFNSFFRRQGLGEYELVNWDGLWGLLALITIRKCAQKEAYFRSERRGAGREFTLASLAEDSQALWEPLTKEPTPSQAMILKESLEKIMRQLSDQERKILAFHLQGLSVDDIAAQVLCSKRSVQRTLKRVRKLLHREHN